MGFEDEAKRAARAQFAKLGSAATYRIHGGIEKATTVIVESGVEDPESRPGRTAALPFKVIHVLLEDVAEPKKGDEVVVGTKTYRLDGLRSSDGFVAEMTSR